MKPAVRPVLIVEDIDPMRDLLAQVVAGIAGLVVSGQARNSWEARLELTRRRPELVLLDEVLPGESSLDLLKELKSEGIAVLLLTSMEDTNRELPPGASGRFFKPSWDRMTEDQERLRQAIAQIFQV